MPYVSSSIKLPKELDRRRKITDEMKDEVRKLHKEGESMRSISRKIGIDRQSVKAIIDPEWSKERLEKHKIYQKKYREEIQSQEERTKATREHRRYKQQLYIKGELKGE